MDIRTEVDLIEEIVRIYGMDNIETFEVEIITLKIVVPMSRIIPIELTKLNRAKRV